MKELYILLAPALWAVKNDIVRFNRSFYKKIFLYAALSGLFLFLITKLLNIGLARLQGLSADLFSLILLKGYSLVFMLIFFMQIINGFVISPAALCSLFNNPCKYRHWRNNTAFNHFSCKEPQKDPDLHRWYCGYPFSYPAEDIQA